MCLKKSYLLSIFALFAVLFGSYIITSSDASALSDLTFVSTYSSNKFPSLGYLCNNYDSSVIDCSGYSYLTIDFSSVPTSTSFITLFYVSGSQVRLPANTGSSFYHFSSLDRIAFEDLILYGLSNGDTLTLTLYDHNPFQSSCPICPEIPDNPYDDKLDSIRNAIILVPAVCLLLYFFYIIFGIIIPTTGGKK